MSDASRPTGDRVDTARQAGQSAYEVALDVVLTGLVIIVPFVVTLYVLDVAIGFIASALTPFIQLLQWAGLIEGIRNAAAVQFLLDAGILTGVAGFLSHIIALFVLIVLVVLVGLVGRAQLGEHLIDVIDAVIIAIPGVGNVYQSFRRMGDMMLETGVENFQEVKLVEFPYDDVYVIGFETSRSPPSIRTAARVPDDEGMVTLFLPLAPNPVMGGFLTHIPEKRVESVDMTVEEAVRTIVTSGIATEQPGSDGFYDPPGGRSELVDSLGETLPDSLSTRESEGDAPGSDE